MAKVLHASYSGYFPTCLIELPELATQSLEDAMTIYWRVKSWTITITGELPITRTFTSTAPDETYLVCNTFGDKGAFSPNNEEEGFFFLNGPYVNSYSNPTLYGVEPVFTVIERTEFSSYGYSNANPTDTQVGSYTFFGQSYPLYRTTQETDVPPASGTIEPASYWTYED
jgi:hypothetical protein